MSIESLIRRIPQSPIDWTSKTSCDSVRLYVYVIPLRPCRYLLITSAHPFQCLAKEPFSLQNASAISYSFCIDWERAQPCGTLKTATPTGPFNGCEIIKDKSLLLFDSICRDSYISTCLSKNAQRSSRERLSTSCKTLEVSRTTPGT